VGPILIQNVARFSVTVADASTTHDDIFDRVEVLKLINK